MRIIEVFNKGLGMIVGAFTGLLVPILQIPMAYYLFAKNIRDINPNQNWFITITMTLTIGSMATLLSTGIALLFTGFSIFYGMMTGLDEGLKGALFLPYTVFGKMAKSAADDSPDPTSWRESPGIYILSTISHFFFFGSFSFIKVFIEPVITEPMDRHREVLTGQYKEISKQQAEQNEQLQQLSRQQAEQNTQLQQLSRQQAEQSAQLQQLLNLLEKQRSLSQQVAGANSEKAQANTIAIPASVVKSKEEIKQEARLKLFNPIAPTVTSTPSASSTVTKITPTKTNHD